MSRALTSGRPTLYQRYRQIDDLYALATAWLTPLALLVLRLPVAIVFWRSGRTKVEGWNPFHLQPSQAFLFEHQFGLPFPLLFAHVTALAEHVLPILLVLGLATRLSAAGLMAMTLVIQLFVFPDAWLNAHMWWAATLFALMVLGPGKLSLDHAIQQSLRGDR